MTVQDKWMTLMEELEKKDIDRAYKVIKLVEDENALENLAKIEKEYAKLQKEWKHRLDTEEVLTRLYRSLESLQFAHYHNEGLKVSRGDLFQKLIEKNKWKPIQELWENMDALEAEYKNKLPEVEIEKLEQEYKKNLEYINLEIGVGYREIIAREFEKRIRIYRNRLERSVKVDFSTWLKSARNQKGYTLKHLGDLTGISPSYIHRIERNERKAPSIPIAEKLAVALGYDAKIILSMLGQEGAVLGLREDGNQETPGIVELLSMNHYKINGEIASREEKNAISKIISQIIDEQWSEDEIWTKGGELFKSIMKLQKKINRA